MCFDHADSIPILREGWRVAKKEHQCVECWNRILPGEHYNYACGSDGEGSFATWKICERCSTLAAFIVAHEVGEGCSRSEAQPPLGGGDLREDLSARSISIGRAVNNYEDGGPWPVLRWKHLDRVRKGPCDPEVDGKYLCELQARVCA
jgi:hypothetical protein